MKKIALLLFSALLFCACSTKKNTSVSRAWHSFSARYNTYFNGHEAYLEGIKQQEKSNTDDYTRPIPVFLVGNEATRNAGKSNFETAIEKAQKAIKHHSIQAKPELSARERRSPKGRQRMAQVEYNPFLKNAWLMMGQAQFQKGEFIEAASTFAYITRRYAAEPSVVHEAQTWLARCYSGIDWFYDSENMLRLSGRDSLRGRVRKQYDLSMADLLVRQERYADALPYLMRSARSGGSSLQRARLWFLIGQIQRMQGNSKEAYRALQRVVSKNPPLSLEFAARILQTQVVSTDETGSKHMITKLRHMARNQRYKDDLDQVYFALGNIHLSRRDTTEAITAYETGRAKATKTGTSKGVLLLRLADLYWDMRRFDKAQKCYSEAIGMLDKKREGYEEATRRSSVLDKLVPYTSTIHLQDSLQELSLMSEDDRNAAIDRLIELEKKRQAAERKARRDSTAQAQVVDAAMEGNGQNLGSGVLPGQAQPSAGTWYFYNMQAVMQGKETFRKAWGSRRNEDNWRRSNRSVLAESAPSEADMTEEQRDSMQAAEALADSIAAAEADSASLDVNNPLKREYYLKQIPFTEEQKAASDLLIMDGLHHAGIIMKDDLEDFSLARETLGRIVSQYDSYAQIQDVYYQLFLLSMREGRSDEADYYKTLMASRWPESDTVRVITSPNYERNMRHGAQIEDKLYTETYDAFRRHDYETVAANVKLSGEEFPQGANRPKFLFVSALSRLTPETEKEVARDLRDLVQKFPDSDVARPAGMIVKGIEAGRRVGEGGYDLSSLWAARTSANDETPADTTEAAGQLSPERDVPFVCLIAYPKDSIDDNALLYALARFNFGEYMARNFDIAIDGKGSLTRFRVSGFSGHEQAHSYAVRLQRDTVMSPLLRPARVFLISERNLKLLGVNYSYDDYADYYAKMFAPLVLDSTLTWDDTPEIKQYYEDEVPTDVNKRVDAEEDDDEGYDISGETFDIDTEDDEGAAETIPDDASGLPGSEGEVIEVDEAGEARPAQADDGKAEAPLGDVPQKQDVPEPKQEQAEKPARQEKEEASVRPSEEKPAAQTKSEPVRNKPDRPDVIDEDEEDEAEAAPEENKKPAAPVKPQSAEPAKETGQPANKPQQKPAQPAEEPKPKQEQKPADAPQKQEAPEPQQGKTEKPAQPVKKEPASAPEDDEPIYNEETPARPSDPTSKPAQPADDDDDGEWYPVIE